MERAREKDQRERERQGDREEITRQREGEREEIQRQGERLSLSQREGGRGDTEAGRDSRGGARDVRILRSLSLFLALPVCRLLVPRRTRREKRPRGRLPPVQREGHNLKG